MNETLQEIEFALIACDKAYDALYRKRFPVLEKALVDRQNRLMIQRAELLKNITVTPQISHD